METTNLPQKDPLIEEVEKHIRQIDEEGRIIAPEKEYERISEQDAPENPVAKTKHKKKLSFDAKIHVPYIIIAILTVLLILCFFAWANYPIQYKNDLIITGEQTAIHNEVKMIVSDTYQEDTDDENIKNTVVLLTVENNSVNKVFISAYSVTIDANGKTYYPARISDDTPLSFYGKGIEPKTIQTAKIIFEDLPQNQSLTMKIPNISDTKHFIWDKQLEFKVIPEKSEE